MKQKKAEVPSIIDLLKVSPETTLEEAYEILSENAVRHLPVVNIDNQIVGIISERDFQRARISGVGPTVESRSRTHFPTDSRVSDFMTLKVHRIPMEGDLRSSVDFLMENKVSSCIVTEGDQAVGIITTDDLLRLLKTYLDTPTGSLGQQFEAMIRNFPLGVMGYTLSNFGI